MKVHVQLYSMLRRYAPKEDAGQVVLDVAVGTSGAQVVADLGIPAKEVMLITVNGTYVKPDGVLHDGDKVGLFPPVGAG